MGRPTQHTHSLSIRWGEGDSRPLCDTRTPHPPRGGGVAARDRVAAVIAAGTRPDLSFPNPEAKTASADGTAPARVWESRTPPPTPTTKRGGPPSGPPSRLPPPFLRRPRHPAPAPADAPDAADNHHTPPDTDTAAGVLSVTPAINTARQTTNTPTTGMLVESDLLL